MKIEYEVNMDESYAAIEDCDEWGCAFVWIDGNKGVEYNYCVETFDGKQNRPCAFYKMELNKETGYMETDHSTYYHYEIDFSNPRWKEKLITAGTMFAMSLFLKI